MNDYLKNYTSTVPADTSISKIERLLVSVGATSISKEYQDLKLISISFLITQNNNTIPFKLPARVNQVEDILKAEIKRPKSDGSTYRRIKDQAERTAWKIIHDWVEVQISMIKLEQAELMQIFLPYVFNIETGKTYFEALKETGFKQLTAHSK